MKRFSFSTDLIVRCGIIAVALLLFSSGIACRTAPSHTVNKPPKPRRSIFGPQGSPWTILCMEMRGPYRMQNIEQIAKTLRGTAGIKPHNVYYLDEADETARLYYGLYFRKTDPKTRKHSIPKRLQQDIDRIKHLGTGPGKFYFLRARIVRLPTPDVGNPAWNLANVEGEYTLQVAVFEPTAEFWEFKAAAADYCALLRERGFEAYYYHSEGASCVTVGVFGADAVIPNAQGVPTYSSAVTALQQSDDLMKYNRLNGAVYLAKTDTGKKMRVPSSLVHVPKDRSRFPW